MEMCSRAATTMILRRLCRLFLRAFPKILSFSPSLLKTLQSFEHVRRPVMEAAIDSTGLPELPVDILMDIFAQLEIPDLLRAGSVCSSWHAAYMNLHNSGSYQRHQTPCMLYTSESDADNVACIYNLAEERVYRVTLPDPPIRSRYLIGSSNGWLVTADERSELHIVNPITGEQIALPPVTTIEQVKPILDDAGEIQEYQFLRFSREEDYVYASVHALHELRDKLYSKAFVFFDDASTGSYIVVLIHAPYELSIARAGDSKWTWLPAFGAYEDCIFVDGILYAVTGPCGIDAFDLTGPNISRKVVVEDTKGYIYERMHITQTPLGDLLLVSRKQDVKVEGGVADDAPERDISEIIKETREIAIYKVDLEAKELGEINRLHDHILLLGYSQSYCLDAEQYPSLKANHVYLTDNERYIAFRKRNRRDICVFNMESNRVEEIVPPQCWCSWPAPIWITPSIAKMSSRLLSE
ncbi:unnamed protein product [Urochloa humidicola]